MRIRLQIQEAIEPRKLAAIPKQYRLWTGIKLDERLIKRRRPELEATDRMR